MSLFGTKKINIWCGNKSMIKSIEKHNIIKNLFGIFF